MRSVWVSLAAIVLALAALACFLLAWQANYLGYSTGDILTQAGWGLVLAILATGVFKRKNWARVGAMVWCGLVLVLVTAGLVHQRITSGTFGDPRAVLIYALMGAAAAAAVALFLSPGIRAEFQAETPARAPKTDKRPRSVTVAVVLMLLAAGGTLLMPVHNAGVEPAAAAKGLVPMAAAFLMLVRRRPAYWSALLLCALWLAELITVLNGIGEVPADRRVAAFSLWTLDFAWRATPPVLIFLKQSWYGEPVVAPAGAGR